jgi:hypothetical protein
MMHLEEMDGKFGIHEHNLALDAGPGRKVGGA